MRKIFSILLMALCIAAFSGLDASAKLTVSKIVKTKKGYGYVVVKNTGKYGVKAGSYRLGYSQWGKRSSARGKYIPAGGKVTYGFKFPASKFSIAGAKGKGKGKRGRKGRAYTDAQLMKDYESCVNFLRANIDRGIHTGSDMFQGTINAYPELRRFYNARNRWTPEMEETITNLENQIDANADNH